MMTAAIALHSVSKSFGSFCALNEVSLSVQKGEFFALLGPNGAGKTTLISCLAGLARADRGTLSVMGHDVVSEYRQARRLLGVVPQELVFDPFLTVRETLVFQSGYFGLRNNDAWIDEILERLGLTQKASVNMRALSGGMKRRVMVAQALVHRPPVIVLDEPTAGVDVELRQGLWHFVKDLNQAGHTIILTTHYLEEAEALCNRIAFMKQGRLLALEDKSVLLNRGNGREVVLNLMSGTWPEHFPYYFRLEDGNYIVQIDGFSQLEEVLSVLRMSGVKIKDLSLRETDLEQVFVRIMNGEHD